MEPHTTTKHLSFVGIEKSKATHPNRRMHAIGPGSGDLWFCSESADLHGWLGDLVTWGVGENNVNKRTGPNIQEPSNCTPDIF